MNSVSHQVLHAIIAVQSPLQASDRTKVTKFKTTMLWAALSTRNNFSLPPSFITKAHLAMDAAAMTHVDQDQTEAGLKDLPKQAKP